MVNLVQQRLLLGGGREAADACAEVISVAAGRWRQFEGAYRDDISCIVLLLSCFHPTDELLAGSETVLESIAQAEGNAGCDGPESQEL